MSITKRNLRDRDLNLNGTLILDDQDGVFIRTANDAVWDSSFEIIGNSCIGTDNDHNHCVLTLMCPGQGEIFIDGVPQRGRYIEIRFHGTWEYKAFLDWLEVMGWKAATIKGRTYRGGAYDAS